MRLKTDAPYSFALAGDKRRSDSRERIKHGQIVRVGKSFTEKRSHPVSGESGRITIPSVNRQHHIVDESARPTPEPRVLCREFLGISEKLLLK